jgi:hypothetical protein
MSGQRWQTGRTDHQRRRAASRRHGGERVSPPGSARRRPHQCCAHPRLLATSTARHGRRTRGRGLERPVTATGQGTTGAEQGCGKGTRGTGAAERTGAQMGAGPDTGVVSALQRQRRGELQSAQWSSRPTDSNPYIARYVSAELWSDGDRISLHFRSARRQAARDGAERRGRRVTPEAVDRPFVHVTPDARGSGRDGRGPARRRRCGL